MIFPVLRLLRVSAAFAFRRSAAILPGATGRAAWPRTPARNVVPGPYRSNRRLRQPERGRRHWPAAACFDLDMPRTCPVNGSMGVRSPHEATAEASRPEVYACSSCKGRAMLSTALLQIASLTKFYGE